ncbi:hypothetical protein DTO012A8_4838 [Penicillium roqueforti]|uniref:Genomic scaffold, ProqFM164S03 n=1 Tax=Penicillium roqueforti (strain FM164) TaxID=1365484 RepID=W6QJH6_PENRF|nr:hypothetical protein DTO012A8_4838 [Penicillium roqueforti]CDM34349.1 unnamed protein product [Penicillium roqueforti FM164]
MADSRTDMRSDRVWSYQMDDILCDRDSVNIYASLTLSEKLDLDTESISPTRSSNYSCDISSSSTIPSVTTIRRKVLLGMFVSLEATPNRIEALVRFGLVAIIFITA